MDVSLHYFWYISQKLRELVIFIFFFHDLESVFQFVSLPKNSESICFSELTQQDGRGKKTANLV